MTINAKGRLFNPTLPRGSQWQAIELSFEMPEKPRRRKKRKTK